MSWIQFSFRGKLLLLPPPNSIFTLFSTGVSGSPQTYIDGLHTKIKTKAKQTQNSPELALSLKLLLPDLLSW